MVKKTIKTEKTVPVKKETSCEIEKKSCCKKKCCSMKFILATAIIFNLILAIFIMVSVVQTSEKIESIDNKISKLDNFYSANIPEYNDYAVDKEDKVIGEPIVVDETNEPVIGNKDAKVTIYEFSDYECPFCARFYSTTYQQLKEEYIDTGKVKLVFKDFPLDFHQFAKSAAAAANCVDSQLGNEKYYEMHNMIFENNDKLSVANLEKWAVELGVDKVEFNNCVKDSKVLAEIDADLAEGSKVGVSGTPSFVIGSEVIVGAQPIEAFRQIIDKQLEVE